MALTGNPEFDALPDMVGRINALELKEKFISYKSKLEQFNRLVASDKITRDLKKLYSGKLRIVEGKLNELVKKNTVRV